MFWPFKKKNGGVQPGCNGRRSYDCLNINEEMFIHASEDDSRKYIYRMLIAIMDQKTINERRFRRIEIGMMLVALAFISLFPDSWIVKQLLPYAKKVFIGF